VNTNAGNDTINLYGQTLLGVGASNVLGGIGDDRINLHSGTWFGPINGNQGNDHIINYGAIVSELRGGIGNDIIECVTNNSNSVYGDAGSDTFVLRYDPTLMINDLTQNSNDYMIIMDFNPAEGDLIDLSDLESPALAGTVPMNAWTRKYDHLNDGVVDTAIGIGDEIACILFEYA